jgi:hypothetical protein
MLFIIGLVIASVAVVVTRRRWLVDALSPAPLGWMSEQWLTEHRASHPR